MRLFATSIRIPIVVVLLTIASAFAAAQTETQAFGVCKPVSQRTQEVGCWILGEQPVGEMKASHAFWQLDVYPTRADAEAAKGAHGAVFESMGKVWLLSIEPKGWRPAKSGERMAEIGPIPVTAGKQYSAVFMEGIFEPGMTSMIHRHSGPEAWYVIAGEQCLETPSGKLIGRPGEPPVIVPAGPPMMLTGTGTTQRRALVLILHDASQPPTTIEHRWKPKGLCQVDKSQ
jgi:quercetin dioxygenase-like cupin family protein